MCTECYDCTHNGWLIYRHPQHSSRPTFLSLLKTLSGPTAELLGGGEGEREGEGGCMAGQAMVLGAPLEAGRNLYPELQHTYIT